MNDEGDISYNQEDGSNEQSGGRKPVFYKEAISSKQVNERANKISVNYKRHIVPFFSPHVEKVEQDGTG